jgi:DNA polymerase/3'-5' exonuclease PolX
MATDQTLPDAQAGDNIKGADLQPAIDALKDRASKIGDDIALITNVQEAQEALRLQQDLLSQAGALVNQQIDLIAGEAKISADQINAATKFANDTIDKIKTWRKRLEVAKKVLGFFAAISTGSGTSILIAAQALKSDLDNAKP